MKYIGIDYGTKKVGIAVSNLEGTVAFPRKVLINDKSLMKDVAEIMETEGTKVIVIGESLNLSGGFNRVASDTKEFVEALKIFTSPDLIVHYIDERYTTKLARALPSEGMVRGDVANKRRVGHSSSSSGNIVDAHAAAIILQTYLDNK